LGVISDNANASTTQMLGTGAIVKVMHPANTVISANNRLVRLVSSGAHIYSTAAMATNSGTLYIAPVVTGTSGETYYTTAMALALSQLMVTPGMVSCAASDVRGLSCTWKPGGPTTLAFTEMGAATSDTKDSPNFRYHDVGGFVMWGTGLATGTTLNVELVINLEGVPLTNAYLPTGTSVVDDPLALADANNEIAEADPAKQGTGGFDGLTSGGHQLFAGNPSVYVAHAMRKVSCKGACQEIESDCAVTGALIPFSKPAVTLSSSRKSDGKAARMQRRYEASSGQSDTFTDILNMLLPIVSKVAPALMAMF